ncbi:MAG TPA: hypothetical protein VK327_00200, partial [Candidatus Paceibacterota bacterium]|nr:hypothetical protein [Candidatus Paceibacterota bacterium]
SLVNGIYFADSLGQLMKTEFNAFVWWDFRNGIDYTGNMDSSLYGWKNYGDLGMVSGLNTRHPTFYAAKLMQSLVQPGETVLDATSDSLLLSGYAARRASGAVTLLVLNKDSTTNLTAQIALNGFVPGPDATVRFFGIPQDEAARTNGPVAAQDISLTAFPAANSNFNHQFPPLSMTLFTFIPTAPKLIALPVVTGGERVLQLQGQPDVRYVLQASTNLQNWISIATNTLTGSTLVITNPVAGADVKFWRAVWQP